MLAAYEQLDPASRVWIYQCDRKLTDEEVLAMRPELTDFLEQWTAHNRQLYTWGDVLYHRFVVIMADERYAGASGCSIDKSVHFVEYLEKKYRISLLSRTLVAYLYHNETTHRDAIKTCQLDELAAKMADGTIDDDTLVFDNLVKTKADFESSWQKPVSASWHRKFV